MLNHEFRRKGIGASDVATILDLAHFKDQTPLALYYYIKRAKRSKDNACKRAGKEAENKILDAYEKDKLIVLERNQSVVDKTCEIFRCTLDGINRPLRIPVEAKTSYGRWGNGAPEAIPLQYTAQVAYQAAITDADHVDIAVKFSDSEVIEYFIYNRNEKLEKGIRDKVLAWWEKHIVGDIKPAAANQSDYDRFIDRKLIDAPDKILKLYEQYKKLLVSHKKAEEVKATIKEWAKETCQGNMDLLFPDGTVLAVQSFKNNPVKVDTKEMKKDKIDVDKYTSRSRSLCFTLK
jgi:predicted phage-related endonuclease